jgi:hypothetical protein
MGMQRLVEGEAPPGYVETLLARLLRALGVPAVEVRPLAARALEAARALGTPRTPPLALRD